MGYFNDLLKRKAYKEALRQIEMEDKLGIAPKLSKAFDKEDVIRAEERPVKQVEQLYAEQPTVNKTASSQSVEKQAPKTSVNVSASKKPDVETTANKTMNENRNESNILKEIIDTKYKKDTSEPIVANKPSNNDNDTQSKAAGKDWLMDWLDRREREYQNANHKDSPSANPVSAESKNSVNYNKKKSGTDSQGEIN